MSTTNIQQTLSDIDAAVEKIKNDAPQNFPEAASIGDTVRQGDLYIQLIDAADLASLTDLYAAVPTEALADNLQLAPGNTKGSRHVIEHTDGLLMWQPVKTEEAAARHVCKQNGIPLSKRGVRPVDQVHTHWREFANTRAALLLAGPVFKCTKPNTVVHPEHGNWNLPVGTYRVIFQRTVNDQEAIQRVLD